MYLLGAAGNSTAILIYILIAIQNLANAGFIYSGSLTDLAAASAHGLIYSCIIPLLQAGSKGSVDLLLLGLLSKSIEVLIIAFLVTLVRHSQASAIPTG